MPFVKIWIHAVWTTKKRVKTLVKEKRQEIFWHILENGIEKGILMDSVNGHAEHVHCLFRLKSDQTIMKCMQLIKGESSFWVNKNNILSQKLIWQTEYYAVSVSESVVPKVRAYIMNQEIHHQKSTWQKEYDEFISKYGFEAFNG